jgi:hypothetical protein
MHELSYLPLYDLIITRNHKNSLFLREFWNFPVFESTRSFDLIPNSHRNLVRCSKELLNLNSNETLTDFKPVAPVRR